MADTKHGIATSQRARSVYTFHRLLGIVGVFSVLTACSGPGPLLTIQPTQATSAGVPTIPVATQVGATGTVPTVPVVQPTIPDSLPATAPPAMPTVEIVLPPAGNAAWNAIKQDYSGFDTPRTYALSGNTLLWWYDTATAQFVPLGWVSTSVEAIGQFRVRWQGIEALVVPFTLNASYGLTLDSSMIERIQRAGYTEATIETFIYLAPDIVPLAQ